jgi:tetrapyrrole methylase family protein/MazG family protein
MPTETQQAFERLYQTIKTLRNPGGCPWDIEQTPETLRGTLIEEAYETVEAINDGDSAHVCEEVGDVFLNAVMLSYIYEQAGDFTVAQSLDGVSDKLIRRHPHVFGKTAGFAGPESGERTDTAEKVLAQWDLIKRGVEGRKADSILDEVSKGMPALERAQKLQKKAAKTGFDWPALDAVWAKVDEELAELREAVAEGDETHIEDELGDLLFAIVNIARHLKVDPGLALTRTNAKFTRRFKAIEHSMKEAGFPMDKSHFREMDRFWDEAKAAERTGE